MSLRLTIDATGAIHLPKELLKALGLPASGFVKLSSYGRDLVIERSPLQPLPSRDKD